MNFETQIGLPNLEANDPDWNSKINNYIKENLLIPNNLQSNNFYRNIGQDYVPIFNGQEEIMKTLILDLDETLIHSTPIPMNKYDSVITV